MEHEVCTICLSNLSIVDSCLLTPCGHKFHTLCIQTWLLKKTDCPICRASTSACHHGHLVDHDKHVLAHIIESQQAMIDTLERDCRVVDDAAVAQRMRMEILAQDAEQERHQRILFELLTGIAMSDVRHAWS